MAQFPLGHSPVGNLEQVILSFVNRSFLVVRKCLSGKICRIMPQFCAYMQAPNYAVPWQTNNTFIGISYLQNRIKLLQFAPVCQAAEASVILQKTGQMAKSGNVWQILTMNRSQNVVFYRAKYYLRPGVGSHCFAVGSLSVGSLLNP